jgi:hypothetical protein
MAGKLGSLTTRQNDGFLATYAVTSTKIAMPGVASHSDRDWKGCGVDNIKPRRKVYCLQK